MFCQKCGKLLPEDVPFCPNCGYEVYIKSQKTIQLRCKTCDGIMSVKEDNTVAVCPYCGSSELIVEDSDVTIEKIRSKTVLEQQKLRYEYETEKEIRKTKRTANYLKIITSMFIICIMVFTYLLLKKNDTESLAIPEKIQETEIQTDERIESTEVMTNKEIIETAETLDEHGLTLEQLELVTAPTEDFVIERLKTIEEITAIEAATEENDPNNNLNKPSGYTADVYFSSSLVDPFYRTGDVLEDGTDSGGSIEVFRTAGDADKRNQYLAVWDGTVLSSGSHCVVGTLVIRTSAKLSASKQHDFEEKIIRALTKLPE